jgi:hypothetical protein
VDRIANVNRYRVGGKGEIDYVNGDRRQQRAGFQDLDECGGLAPLYPTLLPASTW